MPVTIGFDATAAAQQAAGIGRYTRHLLAALSQRDDPHEYRVYYCARGPLRGELPELDGRFHVRAVPLSDRAVNLILHRVRLPIPAQLLAGRFDVFHSPDFSLPLTAGKPSLLTIHDLAFLRVPECAYPTLRAYLQSVVPRAARRAAAIITVSENTRRDVLELLEVSPEKVVTIREGVDSYFHPLEDRGEMDAHIRTFGVTPPYVLTVGTLEPRKNYVRLLDAFAMLRRQGLEHQLVIAGSPGWLYEPIFRRLAELHLEDRVRFVRPGDRDLLALYNGADAFVYPSLYEGFGLPPLEAMACGIPVACSNASSLPEVIGDAGVLFNPHDTEEIAGTLSHIVSDASLRHRLRHDGPLRAGTFSWSETARRTAELYELTASNG